VLMCRGTLTRARPRQLPPRPSSTVYRIRVGRPRWGTIERQLVRYAHEIAAVGVHRVDLEVVPEAAERVLPVPAWERGMARRGGEERTRSNDGQRQDRELAGQSHGSSPRRSYASRRRAGQGRFQRVSVRSSRFAPRWTWRSSDAMTTGLPGSRKGQRARDQRPYGGAGNPRVLGCGRQRPSV
jgi:hypothetical protein